MELKDIQELIKILDESKITSFELEKEGFKICLKKEAEKIIAREIVQQGVFSEQVSAPVAGALPNPAPIPAAKVQLTIDAPIVGTFYAASAPGEKPYVQVGSKVKKGDVLCIIEAMKLMNEIEADEDLEILEILAENGQMVEYGQPLFAIKK